MARALAGRAALPDLGAAPVQAAPAAVSRQRIRGALNLGLPKYANVEGMYPKIISPNPDA